MPEQYGAEDYGEDVFGGLLERNIDETVDNYLPEVFPVDDEGRVITRYIDAHEEEFGGIDGAMSYTQLSHYVQEAEGDDLDRVGRLFGALGERGDRDRDEYQTYLSNLINSFNARGTVSGLRFAVAAAASTQPENVVIEEDFLNNEYELSITDTETSFLSSSINELAALADPSGVELASPPIIITAGDEIELTSDESTVIESTSGLGSGTLDLDGSNTLQ